MMRNRDSAALAAFQAAELLARRLASPHYLIPWTRGNLLLALVRLGQTRQAGQFLDGLSDADREHGEIRVGEAALRLAAGDPRAATAALAPDLDGSAPVAWQNGLAQAYVLEAIARDALGDPCAADGALERAVDLAEPDGQLLPFLLHPAPGLLDRLALHGTTHPALVAEIRSMLAGPGGAWEDSRGICGRELQCQRLSSSREQGRFAGIVPPRRPEPLRTHVKNLYAKLGTRHRTAAVERARALGLLAPSRTGRTAG
jgi:LuxR family maltose regulon positive regulatory protein